ncbi:tRNA (adenosine(37)-N6)-threonylcarbamoyltransferase complex ATPase subunit type 1 TsaE [Bdellovibrio sp. qaytius]|nr:tRNA (adenosine(37)-N6)-threonylcarbamoyltransferase complex ATPase subunit type 1 TsaE [Bdellovibrio sp. qaytius]
MARELFFVHSMADWNKVIDFITPKLKDKSLFLLEGDLGAGKTTLVSLVAKKLNIQLVSSPTFSIISQHKNLTHVDLYRLETMEEIDATGFWEIFEENKNIVFVEWSQKISDDLWPLDWDITKIVINKKSDSEREVIISEA